MRRSWKVGLIALAWGLLGVGAVHAEQCCGEYTMIAPDCGILPRPCPLTVCNSYEGVLGVQYRPVRRCTPCPPEAITDRICLDDWDQFEPCSMYWVCVYDTEAVISAAPCDWGNVCPDRRPGGPNTVCFPELIGWAQEPLMAASYGWYSTCFDPAG